MGLINNLFKKMKETGYSLDEFINQNVIPGLIFTETVDMSDLIGIDSKTFIDCFKKNKNIHSIEEEKKLQHFLIKAKSYTEDTEFNSRLINKLTFIRDYGEMSIDEDRLVGEYKTEEKTYKLEIKMLNNKIIIENLFDQKKSKSICQKLSSGKSIIKYEEEEEKNFALEDRTSVNKKKQIRIESYNEEGIEESRYEKERVDNYDIMKANDEKIIHESSPFKNYTNKEFYYRAGKDTILVRMIKKYIRDEDTMRDIDTFLIGKNYAPDSKKLQKGGEFIWYDQDLHEKYINQEVSIDDVWNLRGDAYQKKKNS